MNSRSQIRSYKPAFVLQRYFCTFVANPSDSISDVVIQMHFLSLYKDRICVYSTRTDFKRNSYTNSYTKIPSKHEKNRNRITSIAVSTWCHQKMSFISKWLYIFALKNCYKRNLPLLLHLISALFCSVSQSRVPTLMQR